MFLSDFSLRSSWGGISQRYRSLRRIVYVVIRFLRRIVIDGGLINTYAAASVNNAIRFQQAICFRPLQMLAVER